MSISINPKKTGNCLETGEYRLGGILLDSVQEVED
jgi:hypothetical protein